MDDVLESHEAAPIVTAKVAPVIADRLNAVASVDARMFKVDQTNK
ncbi:MAG: hypothetical protein ABWY05_15355 [Noviherbaspirillum sp.]